MARVVEGNDSFLGFILLGLYFTIHIKEIHFTLHVGGKVGAVNSRGTFPLSNGTVKPCKRKESLEV